jgi:hypothetical protein
LRRIAAPRSTDAKQAGVAERQGDHGRVEILFVTILMQAHARVRGVEIDQTGLRRMPVTRERRPQGEQNVRDGRPRQAGRGMRRLITVARFIRHPAERAAIGHAHGQRLAASRHARRIRWRLSQYVIHGGKKVVLCGPFQVARKDLQTLQRPGRHGDDR